MSVEASRPKSPAQLLHSAENPGPNLRPHADIFVDCPRHGRHGADARRRQNLRRRLSPGGERKISGAVGLRHLQQGLSRSRHGGGAAAAAGLVGAVDRADGGRRHQILRFARLCPCDRFAARRRQVGRRRLARVGLLRSDRVDRGAAMVRRQRRAWSASPASAPSSSRSPRSSRRISRRSSRSIHAAPTASLAAFATNIPAASFTCSVIWSGISRRCISTKARPARCRRNARSSGAKQ